MQWWVRPFIRLIAAILLPVAVPGLVTAALWALPGDPAEIICPPQLCTGTAELAKRWGLDQGPLHFWWSWIGKSFSGELGNSWRVAQGLPVSELVSDALPNTAKLVALALVPIAVLSALAVLGWLPRRLDALWTVLGLVPSVIFALVFTAWITVTYGALSYEDWPGTLRLLCGAVVLAVADGALAAAVIGTRGVFDEEAKQRYAQIAILRGESSLSNALPNVLPALVGQLRARVLHLLSGAVVVEVVLGIDGLGDLLWKGTLTQDFAVVIAAAWAFSLLSGALLAVQGVVEIAVAVWVRYSPQATVARGAAAGAA